MNYIQKAANNGYPNTLYLLASMHLEGVGFMPDKKKRAVLFKKLVDDGYVDAMYQFGCLLHNGEGVEIDMSLAVSYFKKCSLMQ